MLLVAGEEMLEPIVRIDIWKEHPVTHLGEAVSAAAPDGASAKTELGAKGWPLHRSPTTSATISAQGRLSDS